MCTPTAALMTVQAAGSLYQGIQGYQTAQANQQLVQQQAQQQQVLTATQDQRTLEKFHTKIADQAAQLAGRGINLASPTAVYLGQEAGKEMSFQSQAIRSQGAAAQDRLSAESQMYGAKATSSLLSGVFSASGTVLKDAPQIWPGLKTDAQKVIK